MYEILYTQVRYIYMCVCVCVCVCRHEAAKGNEAVNREKQVTRVGVKSKQVIKTHFKLQVMLKPPCQGTTNQHDTGDGWTKCMLTHLVGGEIKMSYHLAGGRPRSKLLYLFPSFRLLRCKLLQDLLLLKSDVPRPLGFVGSV